jgi:hypothetical protein
MNLQERLDGLKSQFESSAPKEMLEVVHRATEDLYKSGIMKRAAKEGAKAPDFTLNNGFGKPIDLKAHLKKGAVVLGFYRGRW